jgi:hypothetical protein
MKDGVDNTVYPSLINVSFGMKIIENHTTEVKETVTRYRYNFDGLGNSGIDNAQGNPI